MKKRRRKASAFVPSVVFGTAFVGVVPACVVACGSDTSSTPPDAAMFAVAAVGYCAFCDGGPDRKGGGGDAPSESSDGAGDGAGDDSMGSGDAVDVFVGVADTGFGGG
jgi:hypothetical protein